MDSEQIREIAREEAKSVYDEYTIIDTNGKQTTFGALQQRINAIAPDLNRRETFKLAAVAFGYIGMGFTITGAVGKAVFGSARADATGEDGTQADPLTKLWVHEIESGDGASEINIPDAVSLESLVIGGTLYEEDANSPFTPSATISSTYTIAGDYDEVIVIPQRNPGAFGFNNLRVNGNSDSNYRFTNNSDTETTGQTEWVINSTARVAHFGITHNAHDSQAGLYVQNAVSDTGLTVLGTYLGTVNSLDSFTVIDSTGTNRAMDARVFGRVMSI